MGGLLRAASALALCLVLNSCAAAIASRSYDPNVAQDGIVYRLPATELVVAATYELQTCAPAVTARLVGLTLSQRLAPSSDDGDAYVIDPEALHTALGSVGPARVELRNGMLASVGITTTSDVGALISLAAKTIAITRPGRSTVSISTSHHCTESAAGALERYRVANNRVKSVEEARETADAQFRTAPTQDRERLVNRLDAQLTAASAASREIRDAQLRRTLTFVCRPLRAGASITLSCGEGISTTSVEGGAGAQLTPQASQLAPWVAPSHATDTTALAESLRVTLTLAAHPAPATGAAARPAPGERRDGVYYRRPATGLVALHPAASRAMGLAIDATPVSLPQLGQLSFLEMRGARIGGRSLAVAFDETGAIKTYEYTSSGAAREIMTAAAESARALETDELTDLQREIDLLNRRRELIEAQEKLDEAMDEDETATPAPQ